ncbi:MAG TPA: PucR family transcriptional regulator ligand-binding domain-containing protein, partial [Chloroflexota bacterium]|nr:PucR family transcriptional regulator ligand-binding domain-containing protein [Chloroflexota bacterium]
MFAVSEALELEVLRRACVVAGARGLGREVQWAHVVDVPDVLQWVRAGDLLLTTAVSLRDHPQSQQQLVPDLHRKGLAGLVLAIGGYLERMPEAMRVQADDLDFPLIELPWDVPFQDVVMAVSEQIINAQNTLLQRTMEIHDRFTARVLEGGGLADLVSDLAAVLARSALIVDTSFTIIATTTPPGAMPVIEQGPGDTLPGVLLAHLRESMPPSYSHPARAWRVPPHPDNGLRTSCVVAPVAVGSQTLGYVVAGATHGGVGELDLRAAERAATVAALLLYKECAVREAESRMEGSLIDRLLTGNALDEATVAAAQRYGLEVAHRYGVAILAVGAGEAVALLPRLRAALAQLHQPLLVGERDCGIVLFLHAHEAGARSTAERLVAALGLPHPLRLALGRGTGLRALASGYQQARESLAVAARLAMEGPVIEFDELGLLHWLWTVPPTARADNAFARKVQLLAEYDGAKQTDLLATLEAYLRHDGAINEAAQVLHVHRHTLTYRLEKIERLCDLKLATPLVRLNLQ